MNPQARPRRSAHARRWIAARLPAPSLRTACGGETPRDVEWRYDAGDAASSRCAAEGPRR